MSEQTASAEKKKVIGFWIATALVILGMGLGGVGDLVHVEGAVVLIRDQLGYPAYLLTIIGVAKLAGTVVVAAPKLPRLKEWAYAGMMIDLLGATASHLFVGDVPGAVPPVLFGAVVMASWALRPADRKLA